MSTATHTEIQSALQTALLTLSVATTGLTTLSASATGYVRTAGSFLTDGFAAGMEVTPVGFSANTVSVITRVTALTITVKNARYPQASASGRRLTVGLPSLRLWENADSGSPPPVGVPYVEEQYIPGPAFIGNDGDQGILEMRPMYAPRVYVPSNTGFLADSRYADAIQALYAPGTQFTLASGNRLTVRGDVAPYRAQRTNPAPGWSCIPVTIPLRCTSVAILT